MPPLQLKKHFYILLQSFSAIFLEINLLYYKEHLKAFDQMTLRLYF